MELIKIEILNPKARNLIMALAELKLIKIKKEKTNSEFYEVLKQLRGKSDSVLNIDDITNEVEFVRKQRYEK